MVKHLEADMRGTTAECEEHEHEESRSSGISVFPACTPEESFAIRDENKKRWQADAATAFLPFLIESHQMVGAIC